MELNVVGFCKKCIRDKIQRIKDRYKGRKITFVRPITKVSKRRFEATIKIEK